jgi:Ca2+-binding RTX toxin-like protein
VSFVNATGGVTVNLGLSTTQSIGGGMGKDTLVGINRLVGSNFFDTITLGADNDTVQAGSGGSFIVGNGGDDVLIGGAGGGASGPGNTIYAFGGNNYLQAASSERLDPVTSRDRWMPPACGMAGALFPKVQDKGRP